MKQLLFLVLLTSNSIYAQNLYFPPNTGPWENTSPDSLDYCQDKIDSLYSFLEENNSKGFILLKDGKIVLEKYFGTFTEDSLWYWASAGKTLTAFIVGLAQQENFLSISDSTSKYLGSAWTSANSAKEKLITIKDQLSMTSGLDDGVSDPDCTVDTCLQYLSDAGTRWAYHNAPYTLLDSVIYHSTGQSINLFMQSRLKSKIGMGGLYVKLVYNNVYFSNVRSMARFGLLLLAQGEWNGNKVMTDTMYFNEMTNTSQNLNESYGYLTWLNGKSTFMIPQSQIKFPGSMNVDAPSDMYAAMGKNGQVLNIVPSENLVWVRMGNPPNGSGGLIAPIFNNEIWKKINELKCNEVGINQLSQIALIDIYPNPANDYLNIRSEQRIQKIEIFDLRGNKVKAVENPGHEVEFDLSNIPSGIYMVQITDFEDLTQVRRFVKLN